MSIENVFVQKLLDDAFYTGLRQNRVTGAEYDKFIDEFMKAVVNQYVTTVIVSLSFDQFILQCPH